MHSNVFSHGMTHGRTTCSSLSSATFMASSSSAIALLCRSQSRLNSQSRCHIVWNTYRKVALVGVRIGGVSSISARKKGNSVTFADVFVRSAEKDGTNLNTASDDGSDAMRDDTNLESNQSGSEVVMVVDPPPSAAVEESRGNSENEANAMVGHDGNDHDDNIEELSRQLDKINPYSLGRKTRQLIDDAYEKFTDITGMFSGGKTDAGSRLSGLDMDMEFSEAQLNPFTTVLVVGATGKVGRILVRKLVLRGYKVSVLTRDKQKAIDSGIIPPSVDIVEGDVGDLASVRAALKGISKVVCCVRPRSTLTGELRRVDYVGVANISRCFQEERNVIEQKKEGAKGRSDKTKIRICNFKKENSFDNWRIEKVGAKTYGLDGPKGITSVLERGNGKFARSDSASIDTRDGWKVGRFSGTVNNRNGVVQFCMDIKMELDQYDGFYIRMHGDEKTYDFVIRSKEGYMYRAPTKTKKGWQNIRIPFSAFIPFEKDTPRQIGGTDVASVGIAFTPKQQPKSKMTSLPSIETGFGQSEETNLEELFSRASTMSMDKSGSDSTTIDIDTESSNRFSFMIDFIKATPSGSEPDIVLVSCAGAGIEDAELRAKVATFKQMGEEALRNSGLGYTVVRPGPLLDEPGGQRALIFDQGDRITQSISCADVADVCLRSLHEPVARNKSFEVCFEYETSEDSMYELVAQVKESGKGYLEPALSVLEENS